MRYRCLKLSLGIATVGLIAACGDSPSPPSRAEVVAVTSAGGVVRFSGVLVMDALNKAEADCTRRGWRHSVPIGFYDIGADALGRSKLLTFECKSE